MNVQLQARALAMAIYSHKYWHHNAKLNNDYNPRCYPVAHYFSPENDNWDVVGSIVESLGWEFNKDSDLWHEYSFNVIMPLYSEAERLNIPLVPLSRDVQEGSSALGWLTDTGLEQMEHLRLYILSRILGN